MKKQMLVVCTLLAVFALLPLDAKAFKDNTQGTLWGSDTVLTCQAPIAVFASKGRPEVMTPCL
jgi:hypothetical protein